MKNNFALPELLAPAGSYESLRAALAAGADAVYFGHSAFSNRMRAKNFTDDGIREAIKLCHDCGAAAHITVNTRVRDREEDGLSALIDLLYSGPADTHPDALIVADLGVARLIKKAYPDAVLHASTQTSLSSVSDCEALRDLGFSRLVIPRELSFKEIRSLTAGSPIEIEMFIHGAHCVSLSGQCLMSFVQGGRSGNRGECAQPCRLPFSTGDDTVEKDRLSLADMCLSGKVVDVIGSGVASLKIEGRLKSPAYVYGVTKIYRTLLDERRNATKAETTALRDLFYRGFTDGYFAGKYRDMSSVRVSGTGEKAATSALNELISKGIKERVAATRMKEVTGGQNKLTAEFVLAPDAPAKLTLCFGDISATAIGDVPSASDNRPITADAAAKNLTKFGKTGYSLAAEDIDFKITDGLWMPLSSLNALRRDALSILEAAVQKSATPVNAAKIEVKTAALCNVPAPCSTENVAEIANLSIFGADKDSSAAFAERFDRIFVPAHQIEDAVKLSFGDKLCASLPVITPDDNEICSTLVKLKSLGIRRVLCHTIGQIRLVLKNNMIADMSFRANITSTAALRSYLDLGCASVTLSPELPAGAMKNLGKEIKTTASVGCIAYGRFPVMTTARCLICGGKCNKGNVGGRFAGAKPHNCTTELVDRMGEKFPVIAERDCVNVIYNSTPIWMGDRLSQIKRHDGVGHFHYIFTTETADEAIAIADEYSRGEWREGRRI